MTFRDVSPSTLNMVCDQLEKEIIGLRAEVRILKELLKEKEAVEK